MPKSVLKLWKIEINNDTNTPNWDIYSEFVICAHSETEARELASQNCGDEGKNVWLLNTLSNVQLISDTTNIKQSEIVIGSFHAG